MAQPEKRVQMLGSRIENQGSLKNFKNSLSRARHASRARVSKLIFQFGRSAKKWLSFCACSGVGSLFANLSTVRYL